MIDVHSQQRNRTNGSWGRELNRRRAMEIDGAFPGSRAFRDAVNRVLHRLGQRSRRRCVLREYGAEKSRCN
jgi:hypothetical protein